MIPSSPAYGITVLTAKASPGFMGVISADPLTGKIYISDARPAGTYTITAKATDNAGAVSISSSVTIKVNKVVVTNPCSSIPQYAENICRAVL